MAKIQDSAKLGARNRSSSAEDKSLLNSDYKPEYEVIFSTLISFNWVCTIKVVIFHPNA